jgi:hypothetical protein
VVFAVIGSMGLVMAMLWPHAVVEAPDAPPPTREATSQDDAQRLARRMDLPLLATADRVVIDEHKPTGECGSRVTLTRLETIAELRQVLRPREVFPTGGPVAATLTFYRGDRPLRTVWVIEGGEWGFERPGTNYTIGADPDLWELVRWHLKG